MCLGNARTVQAIAVEEGVVEQWNGDLGTPTLWANKSSNAPYSNIYAPRVHSESVGGQGDSAITSCSLGMFAIDNIKYDQRTSDSTTYRIDAKDWYGRYTSPIDYANPLYSSKLTRVRATLVVSQLKHLFPISRIRNVLTGRAIVKTFLTTTNKSKTSVHDVDTWWMLRSGCPSNNTTPRRDNNGQSLLSIMEESMIPVAESLPNIADILRDRMSYAEISNMQAFSNDEPLHILFNSIVKRQSSDLFNISEDTMQHNDKANLVVFAYTTLLRYATKDFIVRIMRMDEHYSGTSCFTTAAVMGIGVQALTERLLLFSRNLPMSISSDIYHKDTDFRTPLFQVATDPDTDVTALNSNLRKDELPYYTNGTDEILTIRNPIIWEQVKSKIEADGGARLLKLITDVMQYASPVRLEQAVAESSAQIFI